MNYMYITVILAISFSIKVFAYSGGAPTAVCEDMKPKHPAEPQSSKIPFNLKVKKTTVTPGERVEFTFSGNNKQKYKGFFIQCRPENSNEAVGMFEVSDTDKYMKTIDCPKGKKNAVTHKNNEDKTSTSVNYIVPDVKGKLTCFVTVALNGAVYWVKHGLAVLTVK